MGGGIAGPGPVEGFDFGVALLVLRSGGSTIRSSIRLQAASAARRSPRSSASSPSSRSMAISASFSV